ncbi:CBN-STR-183 protein [Caenorhabditis brenneri]|uniref:Serpentine receptor class r-10 n=1 Tax=Caenorhabditis brenneri TaxID=135651 RepID=G0NTJ8_CAEBE|nr:CBN-STR-183 protein [Caenorhabditis brenneri]
MYKDWLSIQNRIQHVSTGISFFLNSVLIYLICIYSPKKIGTYKYLMIYISVFQMFYSIMDAISLPVYHTVSSVFVVFKDIHEEDYIPVTLHYWLLVVYTGCYGFCMAIFGIHFFYRFLAVYGHVTLLKTFENFYLVFWLLIPPTFGFIWAMTSGIFFAPTPETSREIQQSIRESYELEMDEIVYIAAFIWPKNENTGKKYLNMTPATGIAIDQIVVVTSLSAIFYFGSRCYYKILDTMKIAVSISRLTQNLHRQLFYALVMQTAIPIMLLHLPVSGLFMFPIMDSELGFFTGFVTITIAMYPAIDPLPTMFVIENYRKAVFGFFSTVFCCRKGQNAVEPSSFVEGQISMSTMTN